MKIAYQGIKGAYSYIASKYLFPKAELLGKNSFEAVYQSLVNGEADALVLPIENTVIGSIFEVYDLMFQQDDIRIVGEVQLRIDHALLGLSGSSMDSLQQIYSHPKALLQCRKNLEKMTSAKAVVWEDTAAAAAYISLKADPSVGAIASATAGKEYGLKVLKSAIQDNAENYTRFVVVKRLSVVGGQSSETENQELITDNYKTSIEFAAAHEPGSLLKCLQPFEKHKLNLSKIESRPLVGSPFQYLFYLDFDHPKLNGELTKILEEITPHTQVLRNLGTYPRGKTIAEEIVGNEINIVEIE